MRSFSKLATAVALLASFSAFAADIADLQEAASKVIDLATAVEFADDPANSLGAALIIQGEDTTAGMAYIQQSQTGNIAVILQNIDASAAIVQYGTGNKALIIQSE